MACGTGARALTLDAVAEQSALGEPLRLVIPVQAALGEGLAGECFRLVPARADAADGVAEIRSARVALEHANGASRLVLTSPHPVNDPAMRVNVQGGCERAVQREYVLLFDPPAVADPASAAPPRVAPSTAPSALPAASAREYAATVATAATAAAPARPPRTAAAAKRPAADDGVAARRSAARTSAPATSRPRLAISRTLQAPEPGATGPGFGALPRHAQEAALAEQEVVLRSRILELSAQVERMQQERIAELTAAVERLQIDLRAAELAQREAEEAARSSPRAVFSRWLDEAWPALAGLGLVTAAIAAAFLYRRRRPRKETSRSRDEASLMASALANLDTQTYLDQSLIAGPETTPRRKPKGMATYGAGDLDTIPAYATENDVAFDRDVARTPRGGTRTGR